MHWVSDGALVNAPSMHLIPISVGRGHNQSMTQGIESLIPDVAACAEQIDAQRRIPDQLVARLKAEKAFAALIPEQFGGLGMDFPAFVALMQKIAQADASTAWCVNQAAVIGTTSLWLPESKIHEIWNAPDTSVANGPPFEGLIEPAGEGYRIHGHWGFSSGCQHATWMMGAARYKPGGWRIAYFRPSDVTFIDNWQVAGLRGTGSFEFVIDDLLLPAEQVADQAGPATVDCELTQISSALLFAVSFAAVTLGVAAGALADVIEIAQGKLPRYAKLHLKDDPDVQRFIGKATARWRSADAYLHSTIGEILATVSTTGEITHHDRSRLRMAGTHVMRESAEVVDLAYKVAGSTGIYQNQTLQRRFQDMHVMTQHVQAREAYYALLGRYAISGEYELGPMT